MSETEKEVIERILENTREAPKILDRINENTEKVLEELEGLED